MTNLSNYIATIFIISLCGTLCEFTLKSSCANQTLQRGLKLVISLALCVSVFIPTANVLKNGIPNTKLPQQADTDHTAATAKYVTLEKLTHTEFQNQIKHKIYSKTGIFPDSVCIDFVTENNQSIIENVDITLKKECSNAYEEIRAYAQELTGATVKINGE